MRRALLLAGLLLLLLPAAASADNVVVTETVDGDDGACDVHCTLREAVTYSARDAVIVLDGHYELNSALKLRGTRTLHGLSPNHTSISGEGLDRVLTVEQGAPTVIGVTIWNGVLEQGSGGGIFVGGDAGLTIRDSWIHHNTARQGGGIYSAGRLTVENTTISANSAEGSTIASSGAGLFVADGDATVVNSTISDNDSDAPGGGVFNSGTLSLEYVTIADNPTLGAEPSGSAIAHSLDQDGDATLLTGVLLDGRRNQDSLLDQACKLNGDALDAASTLAGDASCGVPFEDDLSLMPLADQGGRTEVHALMEISPAIDASGSTCPPKDQRGFARAAGNGCDIGAYEFDSAPGAPVPTRFGDPAPDTCDVDDCSLREALEASQGGDVVELPRGEFSVERGPLRLEQSLHGAGARHTTLDADSENRVLEVPEGSDVAVRGVTITGGNASEDPGGGVLVEGAASLELQDSTVTENGAQIGGGIASFGALSVIRSTIAGNAASVRGGGVAVENGSAALTNVTLAGNTGAQGGGGLFASAIAQLTNVTVVDNSESGVELSMNSIEDRIEARNTVLARNGANCEGESIQATNVVADDDTCGVVSVADAGLGFLRFNGGPTDTVAPEPGSPVLGAGEHATCAATDQRGVPRANACDVGAVELGIAPQPVLLDGSPLDVWVDGAGRFQFRFDGEDDGMFFPPGDNPANAGLEVATDVAHYPLAVGRQVVSAPQVVHDQGSHSVVSTYRIVPDLTVTEHMATEDGEQEVRIEYEIHNDSDRQIDLRAGQLADLYVAGSDEGRGVLAEDVEYRFIGGRSENGVISGIVERTPWTRYQAGDFGSVFENFAAGGLEDTVSDELVDNGVGVEWDVSLAPGAAESITVEWRLAVETTVNTVDDHDDGSCLVPPAGDCTLREAISHAEPGSQITVPPGEYELDNPLTFDGNLDVTGAGPDSTIIRAAESRRVFDIFSADVDLEGLRITGGDTDAGGGIFVASNASVSLIETLVDGNLADDGGGVYVSGYLDVERSTIARNDTNGGSGAGIHVDGGIVWLSNSTISGNEADASGGGIFNNGGTVSAVFVTFAGNEAATGSSVFHQPQGQSVVSLVSALIADGPDACGGPVMAQQSVAEVAVCSDAQTVPDAQLGELDANGGPTPTHALEADSPAIDVAGSCDDTDQRGVPRPQGLACDAGAYERESDVTLTVRTRVVNDNGGALGAGDFTVRLLYGSDELDAAPGDAQGRPYGLSAGPQYRVAPVARTGYTAAVGGACAPDGTVVLSVDAECVVTYDDVAPPQGGGGGGGGDQEPPPPPPDDPVAGETLNAEPSGTVKVKLPGSNRFVDLSEPQQLPVGTVVDVRKGRITLIAAGGQEATFYSGIFKLGQGKGAKPLTTLTLVEKLSCPRGRGAVAAAGKKKRRLWGDGKGKFRTKGKHSAATVVGTKWLVEDRCTSTLTKVTQGRVKVRDFVKKKTVTVRAGKQYVARARR